MYNAARPMPILDERSQEFLSHSPEQTERLGVRLGELAQPGDLFCLSGDLGAGKTTFAKGIARGWGALDRVTSPSFVLINEYRRADSHRLYHFDAFRVANNQEAAALGLDELFNGTGPVMIEWPERVSDVIPSEGLWISLAWVDDVRRDLRFEARGLHYERQLRKFSKVAFGA